MKYYAQSEIKGAFFGQGKGGGGFLKKGNTQENLCCICCSVNAK